MWLASVTIRQKNGDIIATGDWSEEQRTYATRILRGRVLEGVGDQNRERCFRMNVSFCIHRGVLRRELRMVPQWWHASQAVDIAGAPVEVLWSKGVPDVPSAQPCARPRREIVDPGRPDLWVPLDCGSCASCLARAAQQSKACCCVLCTAA